MGDGRTLNRVGAASTLRRYGLPSLTVHNEQRTIPLLTIICAKEVLAARLVVFELEVLWLEHKKDAPDLQTLLPSLSPPGLPCAMRGVTLFTLAALSAGSMAALMPRSSHVPGTCYVCPAISGNPPKTTLTGYNGNLDCTYTINGSALTCEFDAVRSPPVTEFAV